jgi:hypothetical protein
MMTKFVTVINCIDGRVQKPVINKFQKDYNADYIDMIAESGPNLILAENSKNIIDSIRNRVEISICKHKSSLITIVGHYDCAGNRKSKKDQINDIKKSMELIKSWEFNSQVIGLWVNENWKVERV